MSAAIPAAQNGASRQAVVAAARVLLDQMA